MRPSRSIAALAVLLALFAMGGRVVASGFHHHADGDTDGHRCAVCDAVHTVGTPAEPPEEAPAPGLAWWPVVEGRTLDPVIFGITASNSRGPPAAAGPVLVASVS